MARDPGGEAGGGRLGRGILTLVLAVLVGSGLLFGLTAGVGAIWHVVTTTGPVQSPSRSTPSASKSAMPSMSAAIQVRLSVNPPPLGGVKGPNGQVYDAFVPASFTMKANKTYSVTVLNYDTAPHTWTSPSLGVNALISPGSPSSPSHTTFTIHPKAAGVFVWFCATPCDSWAMSHNGFMRGQVTVVA